MRPNKTNEEFSIPFGAWLSLPPPNLWGAQLNTSEVKMLKEPNRRKTELRTTLCNSMYPEGTHETWRSVSICSIPVRWNVQIGSPLASIVRLSSRRSPLPRRGVEVF